MKTYAKMRTLMVGLETFWVSSARPTTFELL